MRAIIRRLLEMASAPVLSRLRSVESELETNRVLLGQLLLEKQKQIQNPASLKEVEFKIFSQWGEDGIIQYLISKIEIENKIFVEFGVEDYREANTRFLLMNDHWHGLVIDGSRDNIAQIKKHFISWKYDLTAEEAFITRENINDLILKNGIKGDIGLLSVDIDGNDYWVWEAISCISPRIVIAEYNSVFGSKLAITVPYSASFFRTASHYSNLYFGASLKALCLLANKKGYSFIGSNSSGANAFFVRNDVLAKLKPLSCEEGYVESFSKESRDPAGNLTFTRGKDRLKIIEDMLVYDIESEKTTKLKELEL